MRESEALRETSVELAMGAFVDAPNALSRVSRSERDEYPYELGVGLAGELQDEREGALGNGPLGEGEVELRAASQRQIASSKRTARRRSRRLSLTSAFAVGRAHPVGEAF
jgi:hypothetical protein